MSDIWVLIISGRSDISIHIWADSLPSLRARLAAFILMITTIIIIIIIIIVANQFYVQVEHNT